MVFEAPEHICRIGVVLDFNEKLFVDVNTILRVLPAVLAVWIVHFWEENVKVLVSQLHESFHAFDKMVRDRLPSDSEVSIVIGNR